MTTLKFTPDLIAKLRDGTKTSTWRLFDDKDLSVGDTVQLLNKENSEQVGTAHIVSVNVKELKAVTASELAEHGYTDHDAMYADLRAYYGDRATPDAEVKMITLGDISCTQA